GGDARRRCRSRPARRRRDAHRRRDAARGARDRSPGPAGAPRGLFARRVAPAPLDGNGRRQSSPGHALLVLAAALPLLAPPRGALAPPTRPPPGAPAL